MKRILLTALFSSTLLLTACSNKASNAPSPSVQLTQLSSVYAGSMYLRDKCGRLDIPDNEKLGERVRDEARRKKWDTSKSEYQYLAVMSMDKLQSLTADKNPAEVKCAELTRSLTPFLKSAL